MQVEVDSGLYAEGLSRLAISPVAANKVRAVAEQQKVSLSHAVEMLLSAWSKESGVDVDKLIEGTRLLRFPTLEKKNSRLNDRMLKDALVAVATKHFKKFDNSNIKAARKIFKIVGKNYHKFVCKLEGYVFVNPRNVSTFSHLLLCGVRKIDSIEQSEEWTHKKVQEIIETYK